MKEIGERVGVDESRISQVHSVALARLRTRVNALLRPSPQAVPRQTILPAFGTARLENLPAAGTWDGR